MTADEQRIEALISLIRVLTRAIKIVKQTHYTDPPDPEFTPDKTREVVEASLDCVRAAQGVIL